MPELDLQAVIAKVPLLEGISPQSLQTLADAVILKEYPAGRTLLMEDAWGNAVFIVVSGWVKVRRVVPEGMKALAVMGSGSFFGEMAVLDEAPRSRDVVALTDVKLLVIPAHAFTALMLQEAKVSYRLAQEMSRRLRRVNQRFDRAQQTAAVRLVHTLVQFAEAYGQSTPQGMVIFDVPLEDLADMANVAVAEAEKVIQKFSTQGLIKKDPDAQQMVLTQYQKLVQATQLV